MRSTIFICFMGIRALLAQPESNPVRDFVQTVRALPPEFSADLLLKVVAARRAGEPAAWRMDRIEEAYRLAARAPDSFPTKGSLDTDTRSAVSAGTQELDVLSLQLRAIEAMLPLNPGRAAAMFREIGSPAPPAATCQSMHLPDWEPYYRTLQKVYTSGFTARERERGEPAELLREAILTLRLPSQVRPVGYLILSPAVPIPDRQMMLDAMAEALPRISSSDREFAATEGSLLQLVSGARRMGLRDYEVLRGLSAYLAAQGSGPRCSPSVRRLKQTGGEWQWPLAVAFNKLADESTALGQAVPRIPAAKMRPEKDAGQWDDGEFWKSERAQAILADLRWLTHGNRKLPDSQRYWTVAERSTSEWNTRYQELLRRVEGWKLDEEQDPLDFAWMRNHTLQAVASLVPPGPAKELAVRRWLSDLEQWYQPGAVQNAWFRALKLGLPDMRKELALSRNPVAAAYAQWMELSIR